MKKILSIIGILFLVGVMFVPLVSAADDVAMMSDTSTPMAEYDRIDITHPSASTYSSSVARQFQVPLEYDGYYLTQVNFVLHKVGSPDGDFVAKIYNGTTNSVSTTTPGALLETSVTLWNGAVISTDDYSYEFTFNSTVQLLGGWRYFFAVESVNGTCDASNYISVQAYASGSISGHTAARYNLGGWSYNSARVLCTVYGNIDPVYYLSTDPTPTPFPSGSGSSDTTIQELTDIILPWLVPLLICLIPALLGYKFVGELGFFIGLNVGCILAYVTLASTAYAFPLWGIILVGVMDVAVVLMRR